MTWFMNLKIRIKLLISFLSVTLIAAFIGYTGIINISKVDECDTELYERITVPAAELNSAAIAFHRLRVDLRGMIYADSDEEMNTYMGKIKDRITDYDKSFNEFTRTIGTDDDIKQCSTDVAGSQAEFFPLIDKMIQLSRAGNKAEAILLLKGDAERIARNSQAAIAKLLDLEIKHAAEKAAEGDRITASALRTMYISIVLGVFVALGLGFLVNRIISGPVRKLNEGASKAASGNLDVQLEITTKDETGELTRSFNRMIEEIKDEMAVARSLQKGIRNPVFTTDRNTVITYMNQAACELFAVNEAEVIGRMTVREVVGSDNSTRATLAGTDVVNAKLTFVNKRNETVTILVNSGAIRNSHNDIIGSFLLFIDMREELKKQREYLQEQTKSIAEVLEHVSSGDLTHRVALSSESDLFELGVNLDKTIEELERIMSGVSEAVNATASAASEISSSSEQIAAGAQEQSHQTHEVAASIEQMTIAFHEGTKNTTLAAENSRLASQNAKSGAEKVDNTRRGIKKIVSATNETAMRIKSLTGKTGQISEITQIIDDIADQTNLLALNAAIEAARAGEQGRGFAVVADEVRKLAERTTKATKEISVTIKSIQQESMEADFQMQEADVAVKEGMHLTEEIVEVLREILGSNDQVSGLISQVAAGSEEQSAAVEEISKNIEGISAVTQQGAAGTEQIARAAEDLNRLTVNLQQMVSRFTLNRKTGTRSLTGQRV